MGANASRDAQPSIPPKVTLVDYGALEPNGVYPNSAHNYDTKVVRRYIAERKLAPFYRGLAEEPTFVDGPNEQVADASESTPITPVTSKPSPSTAHLPAHLAHLQPQPQRSISQPTTASLAATNHGAVPKKSSKLRPRSISSSGNRLAAAAVEKAKGLRSPSMQDVRQPETTNNAPKARDVERLLYKDSVECPICFLYYPANINHSRCCDQPICTECFVEIHRPVDSPSTPASCPFCVEPNFGVVYQKPRWSMYKSRSRSSSVAGSTQMVSTTSVTSTSTAGTSNGVSPSTSNEDVGQAVDELPEGRRKSFGHEHPEVVTIDHIRPNYREEILQHARRTSAAAAIPALPRRLRSGSSTFARAFGTTTTRSRSSSEAAGLNPHASTSAGMREYAAYMSAMRHMNEDLEELMVMEAVRQSLMELEQQTRRREESDEAQEEANGNGAQASINSSEVSLEWPPESEPEPEASPSDDDLPLIHVANHHVESATAERET
ncbi:hypothetical protein BZG36_00923 [Bifiguratus adelaidae]|uniref:RING-type domain-containing protein n=1 Tax=Bifiguratus adelaidae TaxID=1938954 RepID=A0A261Y5C8_9FUNG|nr:hypothetical protein BZG36_00923 [Bifiguratus adelaidae]